MVQYLRILTPNESHTQKGDYRNPCQFNSNLHNLACIEPQKEELEQQNRDHVEYPCPPRRKRVEQSTSDADRN